MKITATDTLSVICPLGHDNRERVGRIMQEDSVVCRTCGTLFFVTGKSRAVARELIRIDRPFAFCCP